MSIRHIGVSIAALLLVAVPAYAQTGRICGTVTNPSDTGAAGVAVTLSLRPDGHTVTPIATTKTADKGDYTFSSVAPGVYSLSYALDGFKKVVRAGVMMRAGLELRIDQRLELSAVGDPSIVSATTPLAPEARVDVRGKTVNVTTPVATAQAQPQPWPPCGASR